MLDDIGAIKIDVFDHRPALFAIEDDVFVFSGRTASLDHHANSVRWTDRGVRNVGRNEESFPFAHEMVDDAVALPNPYFDVAFELIKIFLGIDQMKIVPRVRAFDYHHKKIATIVEIAIAHRRFELLAVFFDPFFQID